MRWGRSHYNYFRDYDAATGRYVESDPIGLRGGSNTYAYVGGNPISLSDLFGLEPKTLCDGYEGFKGAVCRACVKATCALSGVDKICCMVEFHECIGNSDDEQAQLVCSAKLEACNLKKARGPKKPPKDI